MYPLKFEELIASLEKLPGVGNKTAQRYAFSLLEKSHEEIDAMLEGIAGIKEIKRCRICGFLSDEDTCLLCRDDTRDNSTIMVVANSQDVVAIEKTQSYKGRYHVLNGLISSSKGIYPDELNISSLTDRIDENIKEVIIATSPTLDGEMTALYLNKILKDKNVLVTRLAHGLPMGASLDYADDLTLIKAMDNRRKIENE
ncbi:MAG: recombination mediator RecR [Erysipelotrichaceae bacterium]|nr:recombination mediator RecR [Erysipelotrichaceae bacterium]